MKRTGVLIALAALTLGACVYDLDFHTQGTGATSPGSGSTGSAGVCTPGATESCYDGPAGTEGVGICKAGVTTCAADGETWGACEGEVLRQPPDCASGIDTHCDGQVSACKGLLVWAKRFGDASDQAALGIATDDAGSVLVTGSFSGTIDFGGGPLVSAGGKDIFVVKLDGDGGHVWSKGFGDASDQEGTSVTTDGSGNVLVTGFFSGTVDLGGGGLVSAGGKDIFIVKLDGDGGHLWSKRFGDGSDQEGLSVAADGAGNAFITGSLSGTADFGGGPLASAGGSDVFIVKLAAADGGHLWSERFGDGSDQVGRSIAVDTAGEPVVAGYLTGTADFGAGPLVSAGGDDLFAARFDADGGPLWSKNYGDKGEQDGRSVAVDTSGHVLLAGYFLDSVDFGGGPLVSEGLGDICVAKLDSSGGHVWSSRFGDPSDQAGQSIASDGDRNVLLTGYLNGSADFGGGPLASAGGADAFIVKLDADGGHLWSKRFGDASDQFGTGVATDSAGNVLLTGYFSGTIDFGGGSLANAGGTDVFVAKFTP